MLKGYVFQQRMSVIPTGERSCN